jgi:hypothetical protein
VIRRTLVLIAAATLVAPALGDALAGAQATTTTVPAGGDGSSGQHWAFIALGALLLAVVALIARSAWRPSR